MGNVIGDLRRGAASCRGRRISPGGGKVVHAEVPLAEMFGYSTNLRSLSQGRATYHDGVQALRRSTAQCVGSGDFRQEGLIPDT
nr:hypothetical protein [Ralstonia solanacearum]